MPNHIINKVRTDKDFSLVRDKICVKDEDNELAIDFNKIIPMPEELKSTQSPAKIISDEKEYEKAMKKYEEDKGSERFYASRPITPKESEELKRKYKTDNWYDWSLGNWGTKWNAYNNVISGDVFEFQTAWNTPIKVIETLSEIFPDVTFYVEYADEDLGSNCGTYTLKDGIFISETDEDLKFACELWGHEYGECKHCGKEIAIWDDNTCYECEDKE